MLETNQNLLKEKDIFDNPYIEYVIFSVPRLLTLQDRNKYSKTYGCFDRPFWHFKTVTDFPNAACQQAVLGLALLYKNDFYGNPYFRNKKVLEYIIAGIKYWIKLQHRDGSVDEFFPNEHSFVTTSFTTYALAKTLAILKEDIDSSDTKLIMRAISKAGNWIVKNNNMDVANQMLGASLALLEFFRLNGERRYLIASQQKMDIALKLQNREGWFYEYGGPDMGYLSIAIDFLAKYYQEIKQERILNAALNAIRFLQYFIHPDGSVGGEYGSRNTQYILPYGLEIFAEYCDEANFILRFLYKGLRLRNTMNPLFSEDRYFSFFYFSNYVQALYQYSPKKKIEYAIENIRIFPEAKLVSFQNNSFKVIVGVSKNGIVKIFHNEKLIFSDVGFFCETTGGKIATSQFLNLRNHRSISSINLRENEIIISIEGNFIDTYNNLPSLKYLIPFRIFSYIFLHLLIFRKVFNRLFKKRLILRKKSTPINFKRKMVLNPREFRIEDYLSINRIKLRRFGIESAGTAMYNASSTCYLPSEIKATIADFDKLDFAHYLNCRNSMHLLRVFNFINLTFHWEIDGKSEKFVLLD